MNPVKELEKHGQAVWLDFLARGFIAKGDLKRLIDTDGVKGVTSNPSIFEKAIGSSDEYDAPIGKALKRGDRTVADLFEAVAIEDIQNAADVLRPVYDRLRAGDGYVSLEVSPYLAMDTAGTVAEARRLWKDVDRKNLMVKVPATPEGLPAIETLIGDGISINITLLFARDVYLQVAEAYLAGLEKYVAGGGDPSHVASVASFFVSRIDSRGRQAARREDRPRQRSSREGAARRAEGQGRDRQRQGRLPGLQAPVLRPALGQARRQGRQAAADAVGLAPAPRTRTTATSSMSRS